MVRCNDYKGGNIAESQTLQYVLFDVDMMVNSLVMVWLVPKCVKIVLTQIFFSWCKFVVTVVRYPIQQLSFHGQILLKKYDF
jgi:hypothetical protein